MIRKISKQVYATHGSQRSAISAMYKESKKTPDDFLVNNGRTKTYSVFLSVIVNLNS